MWKKRIILNNFINICTQFLNGQLHQATNKLQLRIEKKIEILLF